MSRLPEEVCPGKTTRADRQVSRVTVNAVTLLVIAITLSIFVQFDYQRLAQILPQKRLRPGRSPNPPALSPLIANISKYFVTLHRSDPLSLIERFRYTRHDPSVSLFSFSFSNFDATDPPRKIRPPRFPGQPLHPHPRTIVSVIIVVPPQNRLSSSATCTNVKATLTPCFILYVLPPSLHRFARASASSYRFLESRIEN